MAGEGWELEEEAGSEAADPSISSWTFKTGGHSPLHLRYTSLTPPLHLPCTIYCSLFTMIHYYSLFLTTQYSGTRKSGRKILTLYSDRMAVYQYIHPVTKTCANQADRRIGFIKEESMAALVPMWTHAGKPHLPYTSPPSPYLLPTSP